MLTLQVTNQNIKVIDTTPLGRLLVAGTIKEYQCKFQFDESWDGYAKTAYFLTEDDCNCKDYSKAIPIPLGIDNVCDIPAEVLQPGARVRIGVSGVFGNRTRPTIYTSPMLVRLGATSEIPCPDSDTYEHIIELVEETQRIAQSVRDDVDNGLVGVPVDGTTGQILAKKSDGKFDTEWIDSPPTRWGEVLDKPFDDINSDEMEVSGRKLGIKAIAQAKVTGLIEALKSKIAGVKVNGVALKPIDGVVDVEVPTKVGQLENDSGYLTEATIPSEYITETELQPKLDKKLNLSGGTMTGKLDMGNFAVDNVPKATKDTEAINYGQLKETIAGLGNIFDLKGSKATVDDLPKTGNKIGDVWYVKDEEVGYIWLDDNGVERWEKFGPTIDLSGYLQIKNLATGTGSGTETAMTQKAVTDALSGKQPVGDYATNTYVNTELAKKQAVGDYATKTELQEGLDKKQPTGDYATKTELTDGLGTKQDVGDYATRGELTDGLAKKQDVGDYAKRAELKTKLDLAGGKMTGNIDMGGNAINNLPKATVNTQPVTFEQLNEAISGLGTIFNLKGSKPTYSALPKDNNKIGDVWYVENEEVGYIWIEKEGVPQWERFGAPIDLTGYLQISKLAKVTGSSEETAMTQKATTDELNKKAKITILREW